MVSDMGRVLVRKAKDDDDLTTSEGLREKEMQERLQRVSQREGVGAAKAGAINPQTGKVRVKDTSPVKYTAAERRAREEELARRREEMGPARRSKRREAFEEQDPDDRETTQLSPGFKFGLDAARTKMRGQIDEKTGKPREKGFVSENRPAGSKGAGMGGMQVFDRSGTSGFFGEGGQTLQGRKQNYSVGLRGRKGMKRAERAAKEAGQYTEDDELYTGVQETGRVDEETGDFIYEPTITPDYTPRIKESMDLRRLLGKVLSRDPQLFQRHFGQEGISRSLGRGGSRDPQVLRDTMVEEALSSIRQDPSRLSNFLASQGFELEATHRDATGMGAMGRTQVDLSDPRAIYDFATSMGMSMPQAAMYAQLDEMLLEQGLRMSPEMQRQVIQELNPQDFGDIGPMLEQNMDSLASQAEPVTMGADAAIAELMGSGKVVQPDPARMTPPPSERPDPEVTAEERMNISLVNAFNAMDRRGVEGNPEGFERYKAAVMQSMDNQMDLQQRMRAEMGMAGAAMDARTVHMMSQDALQNAMEQVELRGEAGEFLHPDDATYGADMFREMNLGRRQAEAQTAMDLGPLQNKLSEKKLELRRLSMLPETEKPSDYREQMERMQAGIDRLQENYDRKKQEALMRHGGATPTDERVDRAPTADLRRLQGKLEQGDIQIAGEAGAQNPGRGQVVRVADDGAPMTDSRLDRTIPDSRDKRQSERRQARARRESGQMPNFAEMSQDELQNLLTGGEEAAPSTPAPTATDDTAPAPAGMTLAEMLARYAEGDDNVETGEWMSVGEQLLKGIQDDMRRVGLW